MSNFWDMFGAFKPAPATKVPPLPGSKTASLPVGDKDWGAATTYNDENFLGGLGSGLSWNAEDGSFAGLTDEGKATAQGAFQAAGDAVPAQEAGPMSDPSKPAQDLTQSAFAKDIKSYEERQAQAAQAIRDKYRKQRRV